MKKLTRMKLINWHRFTNCTIDFGTSTLLSGENGAGKSTLLDAIQFVVTCSASSFNKAAHENGKRKLTGYIRCKTGRENKPYERTGELSAHAALEFYEESRKKYFIIGAVVDSASEGQETTVRYLIDNCRLQDNMFLDGRKIRSITEFRAANKNIRTWCKTQTEARKMVLSRLGRLEEKLFRLIPKALAFKPIDDIKDFVYSYVLDEKEVHIDVLRENVRTYQDLERTLESVKKRIDCLEEIEKHHNEAEDCEKKDRMYEYFLERSSRDILESRIKDIRTMIEKEGFRLEEAEKEQVLQLKDRDEKQDISTALRVELKQNKEFIALEEQQKEKERLLVLQKDLLQEKQDLGKSIRKAMEAAGKLLNVSDVDPCIKEYCDAFAEEDKSWNVADIKSLTEKVIQYKNRLYGRFQHRIAELQVEQNQYKQKREELVNKIRRLEKNKLTYPEGVERLKTAIKEEFDRIGRKAEPRILCEQLEITDDSWRNAVEGYLNTQRFYILVEPGSFDIALGVYDRLRKEKKVYGVGLVNTKNLEQFQDSIPGTLSSVVTSKNKYALRYVNMVLRKVVLCDRYEDLKKHPISITRECMRYQNQVASALKPEVFRVPFIGKQAYKVQLALLKQQYAEIDQRIRHLDAQLTDMESVFVPLSTDADTDIKYRLDVISDLRINHQAIQKCDENIRTLKKNATFIQKQIQLEVLDNQLHELQQKISRKDQQIGSFRQNIANLKERSETFSADMATVDANLTALCEKAGDALVSWRKEYETQTSSKSYEQFRDNFDRRRKANETNRKNAESRMINCMAAYKTAFDFGAAPSMLGYPEFAAVYERLRTSELLEYEEKVSNARIAAEEEFREQFLSKLQENMKQAQGEFKDLNKALKDIDFSNERYEFLFMPSKKYRAYYEMIMDDFNVGQGTSIFSGLFHETHKEVIEELFERLTINDDSSSKTLAEFVDYRTYMDYDIRILHTDGSFSYYSKVCEEKSGGETQTPFYVTVAASFVQLYGNNIGGEAAGIVMFDEAFNNMDDERIGGVLEFLNRLPLQIIIAAPPDKIQYISPAMEETLLVMTDEKVSFVEEYRHAV